MKQELRWAPFVGLLMREVRRFIRVIYQTIATPLISISLYLLIFGVSLGGQIPPIGGYSYLAFLIPGVVMISTLRNAFDNASGSIVVSKFCGELEDFRVVPLSPMQIAWGNGIGALIRGGVVGGLTLAIGFFFYWLVTDSLLPCKHPFWVFYFMVMGGLAFAQLGLAVSMLASSFEEVNAINTFILLPLIYLGGVFFSIQHLDPLWRTVSLFNPMLYFVNGIRYGLLGIADVSIATAAVVALANFLLFHLFALWSLRHGSYSRW